MVKALSEWWLVKEVDKNGEHTAYLYIEDCSSNDVLWYRGHIHEMFGKSEAEIALIATIRGIRAFKTDYPNVPQTCISKSKIIEY